MNELTTKTVQMTSREIAELTGKQHGHVKRDIENMLTEMEIGVSKFGRTYFDSQNKQQTEYSLDKRLTLILVSGYSIKLRAKIIDRLEELEKMESPRLPNFNDPADAAEAWAREYREKQIVKNLLNDVCDAIVPILQEHDTYINHGDSITFRDVAKKLHINERKLRKWLLDNKWEYKHGAAYRPYSGMMHHYEVKPVEVNGKTRDQYLYKTSSVVIIGEALENENE